MNLTENTKIDVEQLTRNKSGDTAALGMLRVPPLERQETVSIASRVFNHMKQNIPLVNLNW